jgi:exodeoxyribonuclease V alpha subunit
MESIVYRGIVRRVFFCNPDSPFMAGILAAEDGGEIRFSGKLAANVGDKLEITGKWSTHPKFGQQFDAETGLVQMDESPDALAHLLATDDRFKGIGPARAKAIVDAALQLSTDGDIASALRDYSIDIAARANCPIDVVQNAAKVWNEKRSYFDALALLCDQGWSNAQAQKIVAKLGENAPSMVKSDPYMLIGKVSRFGFRTVDAIARKMGVPSDDPLRMVSGVAYCLDKIGDNGNTWATREALIDAAMQELRPDTLQGEKRVHEALQELIRRGAVHVDTSPLGAEIIADARMAWVEFEVFETLIAGLQTPNNNCYGKIQLDGPRARAVLDTVNEGQRNALVGIIEHRFSLISGGAGVGKTYTMRAVCEIMEENLLSVALCAPTGKAARKLAHATQREAKTIHRLLEPYYNEQVGEFQFHRGPDYPLEEDLIVVDEVSMVDVRLMRSLLRAMRPETQLLLVGDHNQIPSVSPGAILRDILATPRFGKAVNVLTEIVRQAGDLARNTTAVLNGIVVTQNSSVWSLQTTEKGNEEGSAAIVATLVETVATAPAPLHPFGRALDIDWDIQVLSPVRKGPLGTYNLNAHLQRLRQRLLGCPEPEPPGKDERPKPLPGDRVIWTKNDYELGLFNGTQAIVLAYEKGGSVLLHTEDGREVKVPSDKRIHIEVAYAMTIHKAQGSEWPLVILIASGVHWIMHDRNLLYTGASRAAESLIIVGDKQGLMHFAKERRSASRQTFGGFLVHGWEPRHTLQMSEEEIDRIANAQALVGGSNSDTSS